jgi:CheY-like chemotaxis protein/anti-sigma regulatory factor (Ser/Thr protein kinase)
MMNNHLPRLLIVDDDDLNLEVLVECLRDEPYELVPAKNGAQALELLRHNPQGFDVMVLDRMMPGMGGLEVLAELQADEHFKWMPVVMQTSAATPREICEGMEAGVFFYLTKPYDSDVLIRIVGAAVEEAKKWQQLAQALRLQKKAINYLQQGRFRIQTLSDAYDLAILIAQACPQSEKVAFGLNELMVNAVEHGNLQIGYEEKTRLQEADQWEEEISRRQALFENVNKFVEVVFDRSPEQIQLTVTDLGSGFDWRDYQEIKAERLLESHGRGIAMAKSLSFDHLEYLGTGNQVLCVINLAPGARVRQSAPLASSSIGGFSGSTSS